LFAGGIIKAGNFVEVTVVELFEERAESEGEVGVIDEPTEVGIAGTGDGDFDFEAVAVKATAFVGVGQSGKEMRGFELESFA
jgi:hypothetical protein